MKIFKYKVQWRDWLILVFAILMIVAAGMWQSEMDKIAPLQQENEQLKREGQDLFIKNKQLQGKYDELVELGKAALEEVDTLCTLEGIYYDPLLEEFCYVNGF